jgi:hypothetical protein
MWVSILLNLQHGARRLHSDVFQRFD